MKTILIAVAALLWVSAAHANPDAELAGYAFPKRIESKGSPVSTCVEASQRGVKVYEIVRGSGQLAPSSSQTWLWQTTLYRLDYLSKGGMTVNGKKLSNIQTVTCTIYDAIATTYKDITPQ